MPIYPTIQQAAANLYKKPVDPLPGLRERAYSSPEWGGDVEGQRSAAQIAQDMEARNLLDTEHEQRMAEIDREEQDRGDPMVKQIEGLQKNAAYESLLPSTAKSRVQFGLPGGPLLDVPQEHGIESLPPLEGAPPGLTRGQEAQLQQQREAARAKQSPSDQGRADLANELASFEARLNQAVQAGKISPEDAQQRLAEAQKRAKRYSELLKPGYPPFDTSSEPDELKPLQKAP